MNRLIHPFALGAFVLIQLTSWVLAPPAVAQPTLSRATPQAVLPGGSTEIVLTGDKLEAPLNVWTSFPATVEIVPPADGKQNPKRLVCRLAVDGAVPVGIGGLIVATAGGVSDTLLLAIDDLPSTAKTGSIHTLETAQPITLPTGIDGLSSGSQSDFYKFTATAGQRITASVFARRLASKLDPVMWLRDAQGQELAYADDDLGLGVDCRLSHTFAAGGEYVIEVRDNSFRSGLPYRLRIGDFPVISSAYPLGGQLGQPTTFNFAGPTTAGIEPTQVTMPTEALGGFTTVGAKYKGGTSSALVAVAASHLTEALEAEPNNDPPTATPVTIPCAINGKLQADGDRDHFKIDAKKGQRILLKTFSRSLGSPSYVKTRIAKMDGGQLAESPVTDAEEEVLAYTFPADGSYLVIVEDLLHRGGPDFTYRVAIEPTAGFSLALKHDPKADAAGNSYKVVSSNQDAFAITVETKRDGYNGPITLSVEAGGKQFEVHRNVIAEKQKETRLIAIVPADFQPGTFAKMRIVGKANVNGADVEVAASTFNVLRAKWAHLAQPPRWHDGLLAFGAAKPVVPFFAWKGAQDMVYFPRAVGKTQITLTPDRKNAKFTGAVTVLVTGDSGPLKLAVKQNDKPPKETYGITISGPADLADGEHRIQLLAFAEFGGRGQKLITELPVKVVTPMSLTVAPAGPLMVGKKQKVKVTVTRFSDGKRVTREPVTVRCTKLPAGVTGPGDVTFAADVDQFQIDLELTAAAGAAVGKFDGLTVEAVTKFQGQEIKIPSPAASLEVKPAG